MRKPNGYGSIKKLSGNRRRPFVFVISKDGQQVPVEYFSTLIEAEIFQADYNKLHRSSCSLGHRITFEECYWRWFNFHVEQTSPSQSTINNYKNSYNHCAAITAMFLDEIKYFHLQTLIDHMRKAGLSYSSAKKTKSLISMVFDFAIMNEYANKSYAKLVKLGKNRPVYPHKAFTRQQINKLWANCDQANYDTVLILIYTGLRVGEMLQLKKSDINLRQKFIKVTKSKTLAGIRIIPIHPKIYNFVINRYYQSQKYLLELDGRPITYSQYRVIFDKVTNGKHKPHDTRHTTTTMLDNAEANPNAIRSILGHSGGDVTDSVYTHKNLRHLRKAINKLK